MGHTSVGGRLAAERREFRKSAWIGFSANSTNFIQPAHEVKKASGWDSPSPGGWPTFWRENFGSILRPAKVARLS